jgi:hypothetical protein
MTSPSKTAAPKGRRFQAEEGGGRWYEVDGKMLPSITNILGVLDKPALRWWAANTEREFLYLVAEEVFDRHRLQGVLISENGGKRIAPFDSLDGKAFVERLEGEAQARIGRRRAFVVAAKDAADIGTAAHAMVENTLRKEAGLSLKPQPEMKEGSWRAFFAWETWRQQVQLEVVRCEAKGWDLENGFAGTPDCLGWWTPPMQVRRLSLFDWKTSGAIYEDMYMQVAAGVQLTRSMNWVDEKEEVDGVLVRLPKKEGDPEFEVVAVVDTAEHFQGFLAAKRLWEWRERFK